MADNQRTNLARTIVKLYWTHWALFWRIMLPVAILAIGLNVAQNFRLDALFEKTIGNMTPSYPNGHVSIPVSSISTAYGIHPTVASSDTNPTTNTRYPFHTTYQLFPVPSVRVTNNRSITWEWEFKFQSFYSTHLFLLLLILCPLSLAVARVSCPSRIYDNATEVAPPTAREMWRQTGRKAFTVFVTFLLFPLLVDVVANFYALISWLLSLLNWRLDPNLLFLPTRIAGFAYSSFQVLNATLLFPLMLVSHIYLFVVLSLYNPCLILENNSIIGIFRRSYALVSGARLRFFGIYLLMGWITSIITSVLLGTVLLVFSIFIPDLAQIRAALFPLKFLLLFIGGDIEVVLPQMLGASVTMVIHVVKGLVVTFLVPIWGILTTHLYLERAGVNPDSITDN